MVLQFLTSIGCHVTAVCSGASAEFAREYGASEVVDYNKDDFGNAAVAKGIQYDVVFDCVGGRDIEKSAIRSLKKSGTFETIVGPLQYIGEHKLSWSAFTKVMSHIVWRMLITRLNGGPKYTFGEKYPRLVIQEAMVQLLQHDIRMPVQTTIPFEIDAIKDAVRELISHRSKGRTVIDFTLNS